MPKARTYQTVFQLIALPPGTDFVKGLYRVSLGRNVFVDTMAKFGGLSRISIALLGSMFATTESTPIIFGLAPASYMSELAALETLQQVGIHFHWTHGPS